MARDTNQAIPLHYLATPEAAGYLRLKPNTLEKMRLSGRGPKFRGHGRNVVYAIEDLDAWSDERVRLSTSDPGGQKGDEAPVGVSGEAALRTDGRESDG